MMFTETLISLVKLSLCTLGEFVDNYQCLYHLFSKILISWMQCSTNVCTYIPFVDLDNYLSNTIHL